MKVVARPIDMIAWFNEDGCPHPLRFRIKNEDDSCNVIKVDRVVYREKEKLAGNLTFIFKCQSSINKEQKLYELKYEINTCRWVLFKI